MKRIVLVTDEEERFVLLNLLNEILHGFAVAFGQQLRGDREDFEAVQRKLDEPEGQYLLTAREAQMLLDALALCETEIGESEFQTRLGVNQNEAFTITAPLRDLAGSDAQNQRHAAAS